MLTSDSRDTCFVGEPKPVGAATNPVLAPLWRRCVAALVDVTSMLGALGGGVGVLALIAERDDRLAQRLERWVAPSTKPVAARATANERLRRAYRGVWLVRAIHRRNHQTLGQSLMRVRRVDAGNGGPVTTKSAVVRYAVIELISTATPRQSLQAKEEARAERKATLVPELAKQMKQHAGDRAAIFRAALRLYGKQERRSLTYTALGIGVQIVMYWVCILALPKRQSLPDLLAGIVTTTTSET